VILALAILVTAANPVDSKGRAYFPPEVRSTENACYGRSIDTPDGRAHSLFDGLDEDDQETVARNLRVAREPSIAPRPGKPHKADVVRFVWWHERWTSMTIRIELNPENPKMIAKTASVFYRELTRRTVRTLTMTEFVQLQKLLTDSQFFALPPHDCTPILDGSNWFFESNIGAIYDFVKARSADQTQPTNILGKFLFGLTGWKKAPYPFDQEVEWQSP
jgi:hypothetical protein